MTAGRVALVTGGGVGIGAAVVRALAARGCRVALTYRHSRSQAEALAAEVDGLALELDLQGRPDMAAAVERVEGELGPVEILVHNAGFTRDALLPFLSEADWDAVLEVNLRAAYLLTRSVLKGMLRRRWGRVIAVASLSGVTGRAGQAHYSAAKAGLIAFVKSVAQEAGSFGVTANALAPGFIDTAMLAAIPAARLREHLQAVPLGRLGTPQEVAAVVAFLASDEAGYVTGQTIRVDGGLVTA